MRAPAWRIVRRVGDRLVNVGLPAMGTDALTLHAPTADAALANARQLVADTHNLEVIPEAN